jgi:hypothetical protein
VAVQSMRTLCRYEIQYSKTCMTFDVFTDIKIRIVVFCVVTHCNPVGCYQRSTMKMEAIASSETLVTTHKTTRCHNPEDHTPHAAISA